MTVPHARPGQETSGAGPPPRHWLGVAARDHVMTGVAGGFAPLGHGSHAAIRPLRAGDHVVYYAPRTSLGGGTPVQAFVALGRVTSEAPYQAEQAPDFRPWRVDVAYFGDVEEVPIRPLLDRLALTRGQGRHWGMRLRQSRIALGAGDFAIIADAMGAD